jgi:hypothetical protein
LSLAWLSGADADELRDGVSGVDLKKDLLESLWAGLALAIPPLPPELLGNGLVEAAGIEPAAGGCGYDEACLPDEPLYPERGLLMK